MFLVLRRGTADMKNVLKFTYSLIYHQQILVGIANTTPFQILLDIFFKVSLKLLKKEETSDTFLDMQLLDGQSTRECVVRISQ